MNNGAARKSTKLVQANMWGDIFPDPLDEEFLHPFAEVRSQANAAKVIFSFWDWNLVDWDSKLFLEATWPLMSGKALINDGCDRSAKLRKELIQNISWDVARDTTSLLCSK